MFSGYRSYHKVKVLSHIQQCCDQCDVDMFCHDSLETCQLPSKSLPLPSSSATVTKKLSRRVVDDQKLAELQHTEAALTSSDCRNRVMGIQQLQEFVISQPKMVVSTHINKVCPIKCRAWVFLWYILKLQCRITI